MILEQAASGAKSVSLEDILTPLSTLALAILSYILSYIRQLPKHRLVNIASIIQ